MKAIKRLFAVMLALIIGTATATAASAAGEGTITVKNATDGLTYDAYKIADLSYNENSGEYLYQPDSDWEEFLKGQTEYVKLDSEGYLYWVGDSSADRVSAFVKEATDYAEEQGIEADARATADGETAVFTDLDLGWYLVGGGLGLISALTTTDPDAEVYDKNTTPTIYKKVWEDYTGEDYASEDDRWVEEATIDTTDTISYQLTVRVGRMASEDYVITDELASFIANNLAALPTGNVDSFYADLEESIKVNKVVDENATELTGGSDWSFSPVGTSAFKITLDVDVLGDADEIVITYSIDPSFYADGSTAFTNVSTYTEYDADVTLEYKSLVVDEGTATVVTYGGDGLYKVDQDGKALEGVGFTLAKVEGETTTYAQVNGNGVVTEWVTNRDGASVIKTDENGNLQVDGLDADEYIWTEVAPLDGYANISYTVTMWIDLDGKVTYAPTGDSDRTPGEEITVVNRVSGSLPGTGGMGTTIFYIVGTILVAGALVGFLVVRLRKNSEKAAAIA